MLPVIVWVAWLVFAPGEAFGVLSLTPEECEIKANALVYYAGTAGVVATRTPCVRVAVAVEEEE